jgi:hypothetical protein
LRTGLVVLGVIRASSGLSGQVTGRINQGNTVQNYFFVSPTPVLVATPADLQPGDEGGQFVLGRNLGTARDFYQDIFNFNFQLVFY